MFISKKTLKLYWITFVPAVIVIFLVSPLVLSFGFYQRINELMMGPIRNVIYGEVSSLGETASLLAFLMCWILFIVLSSLFFSLIYRKVETLAFFGKQNFLGALIINFLSMILSIAAVPLVVAVIGAVGYIFLSFLSL